MQREFTVTHDDWPKQALFDKDKRRYWSEWQNRFAKQSDLVGKFDLLPQKSDLAQLPSDSFLLCVPFRLQKPYLSKDERDFYLLDNPLRKEKIFQTPMVAATSWKGALRAALWQSDYREDNQVTIRLLGNPRGTDEHQAGRLHCYSTFFDKIGLEVINPHNRETGVGERPILMECVPQGTTGDLVLLYVPFGSIEQSEAERRAEVAQDLEMVAEGILAMLTIYGFGAKTSSGFGIAEDKLVGAGILALRAQLPGMATSTAALQTPEPPKLDLPRYLESLTRLYADFRQSDGSLKSEAEYEAFVKSRGGQYSKKDKQLYEKARKWWEREGRQLAEATTQELTPKPFLAPTRTPPVTELTFTSLSELRDLTQRVAVQLRNGGGG
jgi:CRISPR-associated protein Cmr2